MLGQMPTGFQSRNSILLDFRKQFHTLVYVFQYLYKNVQAET